MARGERRAQDALIAALVPSRIPTIPGLEVAVNGGTRTGTWGTFADVFTAGHGFAFSYGDVAGQREGSDVFGVTAKMTLRALATRNSAPTMVMRYLNNSLIHAFERQHLLTLVFGTYEPRHRTLRLCNGGAWPPIIVRSGRAEIMKRSSAVMGVFANTPYEQDRIGLELGDVFVGYTEGVISYGAVPSADAAERLRLLVQESARDSAPAIAERVIRAGPGLATGRPDRDAVVVVIRGVDEEASASVVV